MNKTMRLMWLVIAILVISACDSGDNKSSDTTQEPATQNAELLANTPETSQLTADFTMDSTTGESFTFSQAPDKVSVYYFGFMNCPDICPTTLAQLRQAYTALGEPADKLTVYLITVDPERDSIENLEQFMGLWSEDFVGLRGEDEQLQTALDMFDVIAIRREVPDSAVDYLMDHSGEVYVVGRDGALIAEFAHSATASTYEHDLRIILDQEF